MTVLLLSLLPSAESPEGDGWIDVCRSGTVYGGAAGPGGKVRRVTLTPDELRRCAEATNAAIAAGRWPGGPPIGANHASSVTVDPMMARRFGWVEALRVVDRDGETYLQARAAWTVEGRELVDGGAYGGISAELDDASIAVDKDTGAPAGAWVLTGISLTNTPMISRLRPLPRSSAASLSLAEGAMPENGSLLAALRALAEAPSPEGMDALCASWGAMSPETRSAVMAEIAAALSAAVPPPPEEVEMKEPEGGGAAPSVTLAEDPRHALMLAETRRLTAEVAALRKAAADRELAERRARLDGWQAEGRFGPAERPTIERLLLTDGIGAPFVEATYPVGRVTGAPAGRSGAERLAEGGKPVDRELAAVRAAAKMPGGLSSLTLARALGGGNA